MARIPRILITGDPTVYHIISRTALQGFPLEDIEKDFLVEQMKHASQLWFVVCAVWGRATLTCCYSYQYGHKTP